LTFGCPNNNTFSNTGVSFSFKRIIYLDICESIPEYFHFLNWSVAIKKWWQQTEQRSRPGASKLFCPRAT